MFKHLKSNLDNFRNLYDSKVKKVTALKRKQKELSDKNCDLKKKLVKKSSDLISVNQGREVESDDPFA